MREELSLSRYPFYPCSLIPLLPFCGIIFPLEPVHLAVEGEGSELLLTVVREAGGNRLVGGIGEGDQWGGRSIHIDGGPRYDR